VLGFSDPNGFDELRIAGLASSGATGFGFQALALDNVVAQLDPPRDTQRATGVPVPPPAVLFLGVGALLLAVRLIFG
jgi:hypothetical protein